MCWIEMDDGRSAGGTRGWTHYGGESWFITGTRSADASLKKCSLTKLICLLRFLKWRFDSEMCSRAEFVFVCVSQ